MGLVRKIIVLVVIIFLVVSIGFLWWQGLFSWSYWRIFGSPSGSKLYYDLIDNPRFRFVINGKFHSDFGGMTILSNDIVELVLLHSRPHDIIHPDGPIDLMFGFKAKDNKSKVVNSYTFWTTYAGCQEIFGRKLYMTRPQKFSWLRHYILSLIIVTSVENRDLAKQAFGGSLLCEPFYLGRAISLNEITEYFQGADNQYAGQIRDLRRSVFAGGIIMSPGDTE